MYTYLLSGGAGTPTAIKVVQGGMQQGIRMAQATMIFYTIITVLDVFFIVYLRFQLR